MCLLGAWIHLGQKKWNRGSGVQAAYFLGCSTNSDCASLSCSIGKEVLSVPSSRSYERANFQRLWNVLIRQAQDPPAETPLGFCCLCQKRKELPGVTAGFEEGILQINLSSNASRHVIHLDVMAGNAQSAVVFCMVHFCCLTCLPFGCSGYRDVSNTELPAGNTWVVIWPRENGIHQYSPLEVVFKSFSIIIFFKAFRIGNIAFCILGVELKSACSRVIFEMISLKYESGYFDCGAECEYYVVLSSAESVV